MAKLVTLKYEHTIILLPGLSKLDSGWHEYQTAKQKSVAVILHQKGGGHTFAAALKERFVSGDQHRGFLHFSRRVATRRR